MYTFQEYKSQYIRTFQWIHKVSIGWMMVLLSCSLLRLNIYALVDLQVHRYVISYWTIQTSCRIHCVYILGKYIFQYQWNVWWSQNINIGGMMVLSVSHSSSLSSWALVGFQMYRNCSSYLSIQNSWINHCLAILIIYNLIS